VIAPSNHGDFPAVPDVALLVELVRRAGNAIMAIYSGPIDVEIKEDRSPLTAADRAAHEILDAGLRLLAPSIPVLSEEGREIPYEQRREWPCFWLVDPLDGTKEFIKRNGEFTVNVALISGGRPVFGLVGVPAQGKIYGGVVGQGSWVVSGSELPRPIRVREPDAELGLAVVQSRSHPSPELADYLAGLSVAESVEVGSSLKFCVIAEGRADLYPRLGPTMEWDTAAGQAVVEAAGGRVLTLEGTPLGYNKRNLLNPHFVVTGEAAGPGVFSQGGCR
jgi:3'(2'), 5'-bisphosphate nucleotidase